MRENLRVAAIMLAVFSLILPGVLTAYDYDSDESEIVLRITDEIDLAINGEIRTRMEWNDNLVDYTNDIDDEFGYVPSRVRLGIKLSLPRDVDFYMEAQELFSFGEDTPARLTEYGRQAPRPRITGGRIADFPPNSGSIGEIDNAGNDPFLDAGARRNENARVSGNFITSTHRDDLGLYQAHITANNVGDSIFSARVGRQELVFGNEWLLGDLDFYGGASLDAVRGWWDFDRSRLDVFWAKVDEQNTGAGEVNSTDDDTDLYGVYFTWPEVGTSLIGYDLYAMGVKSQADGGADSHSTNFESYWIGGRVFRQPEWGWHFNAEATYQFGDITLADGDMDIAAWGFEGSVGYTWDVEGNPDLHFGLTYATGDDPNDTEDWEGFSAPLQDFHPRLGFADAFAASNLMAFQLGYAGSWENLAWGVELYDFQADEDPVPGEDQYGNEVDLWFSYQYSRNLSVQIAYAFLSLDNAIEDQVRAAGFEPDDAQRFYVNLRLMM